MYIKNLFRFLQLTTNFLIKKNILFIWENELFRDYSLSIELPAKKGLISKKKDAAYVKKLF